MEIGVTSIDKVGGFNIFERGNDSLPRQNDQVESHPSARLSVGRSDCP